MPLLSYYPAVRTGYFSTGTHITLILKKKWSINYMSKQGIPRKCISKATIMFLDGVYEYKIDHVREL